MTIAFDCFDRNTQQLIASNAVDMTYISGLPVPGGNIASNPDSLSLNESNAQDIIEISDATDIDDESISSEDQELVEENYQDDDDVDDYEEDGYLEDDLATESEPSTSDQLDDALGNHLSKLIGQSMADILR